MAVRWISGTGVMSRSYILYLTSLCLCLLTSAAYSGRIADRTIILADTVKLTRWADIHQVPDPAHNDPYYHLEVFEHKKGAKPWVFKRLAHHMVITPDALDKSRTQKQAKTYAYKDVEFWITYKHWRDNPESRAQTPVCETTIIDCLRN